MFIVYIYNFLHMVSGFLAIILNVVLGLQNLLNFFLIREENISMYYLVIK